jgi:double-strand break repair protein MRE11
VRGNDSFQTFEEILQLARQFEVDALLLGGDLFHENKPSRRCMHTTMELLRHYCLGSRPCALELLSDPSVNFPSRFGTVNYEDPNFNVALPVFSIHGNHDDPTGDGNLSALDILSTAGLINYFGKSREVDDISMMPVLLRKGSTQLALYGLGNVRDERLHRTFLSRKVKMLAPSSNSQDWFNLLLFHQNRVAHGPTSVIPDSFLDDSLDLVIRGHEHDNQIEPLYCAQRDFYVSQPGSSVATCLSEGECARPKAVALLEVSGKTFKLHSIVLKTVRPFVMSEVSLKDARPPISNPHDVKAIERLLCTRIEGLIEEGKAEWIARQGLPRPADTEVPLPLVRLKVDYAGGFASFNPHRFGHFFMNKVANPKDCLFFFRKRAAGRTAADKSESRIEDEVDRAVASLASAHVSENGPADASGSLEVRMEDLIHDYLNVQNLDLFPQNEFGDAVRIFVEKDDRDSIEGFVKKSLERVCSSLQSRSVRAFDDASLRTEIEREKLQRELEWQRLHPGMGSASAHRLVHAERIEEEEKDAVLAVDDEDFESVASAPNASRRRAPSANSSRGTGRGRAPPSVNANSATNPGTSSNLSSLVMESKPVPSTLPASRWPPRR